MFKKIKLGNICHGFLFKHGYIAFFPPLCLSSKDMLSNRVTARPFAWCWERKYQSRTASLAERPKAPCVSL